VIERLGVLGAGNWIVDYVKVIDVWPSQDALAIILAETHGTGGAPFNVLTDLARLGAPFPLFGAGVIGADSAGDWIIEQCRASGINTDQLHRSPSAPTSYTDVMTVQSSGRRTFFHQHGANSLFDVNSVDLRRAPARILHLGYLLLLGRLEVPSPTHGCRAAELLDAATSAGYEVSIDAVSEESDRYQQIVPPCLPHVDYTFLNEFEAARVAQIPIRSGETLDHEALAASARAILNFGVRRWVFIHFPEGVFAASAGGQAYFQPSLQLPSMFVAGATGAGDAIAAGILLGLHERMPILETLRLGVCAAGSCLQHPSATAGVASIRECLALGEKHGFRGEAVERSV
jgi:sugar/nucleoside kinase (ribokinase family)